MSNKQLNTRIQSKVDTLANWKISTLPLLPGEIAIATGAIETGVGATEPICIIRIGEDGKKTFKDLPDALHAKAVDVLPICKDTKALKEFIISTFNESDLADEIANYFKDIELEDSAVEGQYVSAVNQTNGKISVIRSAFPSFLKNIKVSIGPYNDLEECIILSDSNDEVLSYVDAARFIKDGMLTDAVYDDSTHKLTLSWNTDAEISTTVIDLNDLVNVYTGGSGIVIDKGVVSLDEDVGEALRMGLSSIQTITTNDIKNSDDEGVVSGLIATKGTNNDYNIAIDDSITFIFNCGGSGVTTATE